MKKSNIRDIVLAVTYRCNSRCRMCDIWQKTDFSGELKLEDYYSLPRDLRSINITGGEPFLKKDLVDIIRVISERCPRAYIIISSNGFATNLISARMAEIKKHTSRVGVVFSIDGIGEEHDKVRGIEGGYEKVLKSVGVMREMGINVKIAFTLGDYNYDQLPEVYKLSKNLGVEMSLATVHSASEYFAPDNSIKKTQELLNRLDWLIRQELSGWNPKKWARAYFTYGAKVFVGTGTRILPDYSGESSIFVNPTGVVYPSDISSTKIGKLSSDSFEYNKVDLPDYEKSWMICTARQAIRKHYIRVITWIVINKIKNIFYNRANWFYYMVGFVFMSLNRVRYFVLGYHNPRPIPKNRVFENIEYSNRTIGSIKQYLKKVLGDDFSMQDKNVMEIGPGSDLGAGILSIGSGAKSYTGVDRFKLLAFNDDFYDGLYGRLDDMEKIRTKIVVDHVKKFINDQESINLSNFKYINCPMEKISGNVNHKFDLIFSQAVLEHVYSTKLVFSEMYNVLNVGGVIFHEIDFKTHTSFLRDWDPLNILRFSDRVYNTLKFSGAPNRLRLSDYIAEIKNAGFVDVKIYPLSTVSKNELNRVREGLDSKYKDYEDDDLRVLSAIVVARK